MSKVLKCRDVGLDCDFVATGDTEQDVLGQVAVHADKAHNMTDISNETLEKVKAAIHGE